jgi:heme oxygenase (biliverdin-IX-beta and delta-forming)
MIGSPAILPARAHQQRSQLHTQLYDGTAAVHHALEQDLGFLLGPELSLERYRHLLSALHAYYRPLESVLFELERLDPPLGVPLRQRALLLQADLRALGCSPEHDSHRAAAPKFEELANHARKAGAFYVVEGSCLGGQVISRAVQRRLGLDGARGVSFFVGDGRATPARWERVLSWLDGSVHAGLSPNELVESQWLRANGVTR